MSGFRNCLNWVYIVLMWSLFSSFSYQTEWKALEKDVGVNPKTYLAKVDEIEKQAVKDKNNAQWLRCIFTKMSVNEQINEISFADNLKVLHDFQAKTEDPVALAVSQYMESRLFYTHYSRNSWKIDQRSELVGVVPDDVEEWTTNIYKDKVRELQTKALAEPRLKKTLAADYEPVLELEKDSRLYRPTLLDMMTYSCIEMFGVRSFPYTSDEVVAMYDNLAKFHIDDKDKSAYIMAVLDAATFKNRESIISTEQFFAEMNRLLKQYYDDPSSVLIRIRKAEKLMSFLENESDVRNLYGANPADILFLCQEGIDKFPNHPYVNVLKSTIKEINRASLTVEKRSIYASIGRNIELNVQYANLSEVKFTLSRITCSPEEYRTSFNKKSLPKQKLADYTFSLEKSDYCVMRDTVLEIPALNAGAYLLSYGNECLDFVVSDLFVFKTGAETDNKSLFVVTDRNNGAPKPNVTMSVYDRNHEKDKLKNKVVSGKDGFAYLDFTGSKYMNFRVQAELGNDKFWSSNNYYYASPSDDNEVSVIDNEGIFTDRGIYRPGQTVHFKCIAYQCHKADNVSKVRAGEELKVELSDANGDVVVMRKLTTNEFGSVASSFVLPVNGMSGVYTISTWNGQVWFRVEEYKRPSFEVVMNQPKGSFSFGDSVMVKGSATYFLGTAVQQAKVAYKVTRNRNWMFRIFEGRAISDIVAEGEVRTDGEGNFVIPFLPEKTPLDRDKVCYDFEVGVTVTDANGESQQEIVNVTVGDESMAILCPSKQRVLFDELDKLKFSVVNLNQQMLAKEVTYTVMRDESVVATGKLMSDTLNGFKITTDTQKWKSGRYKFVFSTLDDQNRKVESVFETILYRTTDVRPPVETNWWTENLTSYQVSEGEVKSVRIGTSFTDANLLTLVYNENEMLVSSAWCKLSNEIKTFNYALKPGDNFLNVKFLMVYDGTLYQESLELKRKPEDKSLPIKLTVFRNKVQPGAKENWQIQLPTNKSAELLAGMYDASLDQFADHQWSTFQVYNRSYRLSNVEELMGFGTGFSYYQNLTLVGLSFSFDRWRSFGDGSFRPRQRLMKSAATEALQCDVLEEEVMDFSNGLLPPPPPAPADKAIEDGGDLVINANERGNVKPMHVRSNFAETAFFYPQLTADKDGFVNLNFTMPESLTKWKLMALAHTKDVFSGKLLKEVVSQKDFMVSPNYPRFLRQGDVCVLSAKVVNLTDTKCSGKALLQLLDPVTENVLKEFTADFDMESGKNGAVEWRVEVPRSTDAVLVRVAAVSGDFTDAEQKLLPVLTDRVVVTQSVPMYVRGGTTKEFTLANLANNQSKSLKSRFLKLELASNPVWFAVQALPSVTNVEHENAIGYSAAFFASQMAQHIANSNPRVFNVIERWKQQGGDKQTLLSNLEKNAEVKNVLLNETPWVLDAKNETESRQRLSALFDVNTLRANGDNWLNKLYDYQLDNGGFAWFKNMSADRYTTLFVLDNFCRLRNAELPISVKDGCEEKALRYLDNVLLDEYKWMKAHTKDYKKTAYVSAAQLYYFQVRTLYPQYKLKADCKEAYDFYFNLVKKQWTDFGLSGKASAAICLLQSGEKAEAQKVVKSLREFSTASEEMGMYWKNNVSSYLWQDAAIGTHTRIMEALQMVDHNPAEQEELRIWLLNQKRTQNWGNTIANVDALKVLLVDNAWLNTENKVTVKLGDKVVEPDETEVGTGYFSTFVNGSDVRNEMAKVQLQSEQGGNLSWGALYWQFEENMDVVKDNKTGLHVEKSVMLATTNNGKEAVKAITDKVQLAVGDKLIVRLVVRADRDFEYVALKDQRASCLEPVQQLSGFRWNEHVGYYQSPKDAAMYYFFDHLPKGTYVFEYPLVVTNKGSFSNGITSVQCLYAPDFSSNTGSVRINVNK